jgi:hypothetical protein
VDADHPRGRVSTFRVNQLDGIGAAARLEDLTSSSIRASPVPSANSTWICFGAVPVGRALAAQIAVSPVDWGLQ